MIYADGGWYCFGCHRGGDGAALYKALHGVSMGEALRACGGGRPVVRSAGDELRRRAEAWRATRWNAACEALHAAEASLQGADGEAVWDAVQAREAALEELDELEEASPRELVDMMRGGKRC